MYSDEFSTRIIVPRQETNRTIKKGCLNVGLLNKLLFIQTRIRINFVLTIFSTTNGLNFPFQMAQFRPKGSPKRLHLKDLNMGPSESSIHFKLPFKWSE